MVLVDGHQHARVLFLACSISLVVLVMLTMLFCRSFANAVSLLSVSQGVLQPVKHAVLLLHHHLLHDEFAQLTKAFVRWPVLPHCHCNRCPCLVLRLEKTSAFSLCSSFLLLRQSMSACSTACTWTPRACCGYTRTFQRDSKV